MKLFIHLGFKCCRERKLIFSKISNFLIENINTLMNTILHLILLLLTLLKKRILFNFHLENLFKKNFFFHKTFSFLFFCFWWNDGKKFFPLFCWLKTSLLELHYILLVDIWKRVFFQEFFDTMSVAWGHQFIKLFGIWVIL